MRTAHPLGLSPDGRYLIVVIEGGGQVAIPADEELAAALRNDRPRSGQLEIDMESALRPRDIQARIRGGESLEAVAQAAGVPIAKIEPFAGPVLAEREHVAGLAQTNPVRRTGDAVAHRSLRNVVADRLLPHGVDPDDVEWDAWRAEDRRWTVQLSYELESTPHQAEFSYDQTGRFSTASNDDARWLTGEQSAHTAEPGRGEAGPDRNDELAIVRAIQPQFAVTPDIADDFDDEDLDEDESDDGSSDSEDAFAEGDLAEVDGVYDIVPGDRSNMDVLYDMLSTFDEDSVQIYAGLVRPRPEQAAAPVLHEGPETVEIVTDEIEIDILAGEPTERLVDEDLAAASPESADDAETPPLVELVETPSTDTPTAGENQEPPVDTPAPVELVETPPSSDVEEPPVDTPSLVELVETSPADDPTLDEHQEPPAELVDTPAEDPALEESPAEAVEAPPAAEEPTVQLVEDSSAAEQPEAGAPEAEELAPATRPGRIKPSPAEPEQPSLVDAAGNEPSRSIKRKRASVPSWDEIMFGSPRPKE